MSFDVVVVGGGVNALIAASYLAKAGRSVAVVCPAEKIGGLCAQHEFHPGYKSPGILSDTTMFRNWVADDLELKKHGLSYAESTKTIAFGRGQQVVLSNNTEETVNEIVKLSKADADSYREMKAFYGKIEEPIRQFLNNIPADIVDPGNSDLFSLFKRGFQLRKLGKKDMLEVLRLAPMTVYDWLDEWFENDGLKAALALPAVTESYSGPWSPGTNANLLIQQITKGPRFKGDGLALAQALEKAARANGVVFETGSEISKIRPGKGVELKDGNFLEAKTLIAACGPKQVFLELMDARELSHKFEQRISKFRTRGLTSQLLLAIESSKFKVQSSKPKESSEFNVQGSKSDSDAHDQNPSHFNGSEFEKTNLEPGTLNFELQGATRALFAEDLDAIEKAFDPIKYDEVTSRPCLDVYLPSAEHPDLAPDGHEVISVLIHYTPYALKGGWTEEAKDRVSENVIEILDRELPGLKQSIVGKELLAPTDIKERYDLSGGQLFEGEHALDQLLVRPTPECSQYNTPFEGLFLCSGGSFPGGGLTGAPGALAAKKILAT